MKKWVLFLPLVFGLILWFLVAPKSLMEPDASPGQPREYLPAMKVPPGDQSKVAMPAEDISAKAILWLEGKDIVFKDNQVIWENSANYKGISRLASNGRVPKLAVNEKSSLKFDGNFFLENKDLPTASSAKGRLNQEEVTIGVVLNLDKTRANDLMGWGDCQAKRFLVHAPYEGKIFFQVGSPETSSAVLPLPEEMELKTSVIVLSKGGEQGRILFEDWFTQAEMPDKIDFANFSDLKLGSSPCGNVFTGEIFELLVINQALSLEKMVELRNYLAKKHNIKNLDAE